MQLEKSEALPVTAVLFFDIEITVVHQVRRTLELHVATRAEIDVLALGQLERQLLDKGRHVGIGLDSTLPLLNPENLLGHFDFHVLLDRRLAAQAPALSRIAPGEMRFFSGQHGTAALSDNALALGAGAATATGRGEEQISF